MNIVHSRRLRAEKPLPEILALLDTIDRAQLRKWVEHIALPRHFVAQPDQNRATGEWLSHVFESFGYRTERQGQYANIVATPKTPFDQAILVGAHYDSVASSPGADDNGSAVAAMLACAAACSLYRPAIPVIFVAFNREEDGLLGSRDFVESFLPTAPFRLRCAHVLEMVGYATSACGSQRVPAGLPVRIPNTGDFLGLLGNRGSDTVLDFVLRRAGAYAADLPVIGLKVKLGLEKFFPLLGRSDHASFWDWNIPAVMWTDTSEFRNPHYHRATDTPETLNYHFLRQTAQLLTASAIAQAAVSQ